MVFFVPTLAFLATLNPALLRNDSPETVAGCAGLGIVHAPGYPLFTLLGKLFLFLPLGNPAMGLNFFAAFLGSLAALLFFSNLWFFFRRADALAGPPPLVLNLVCALASFGFSFSSTFWGNAIAAKGGVYILQIVLELAALLCFQALVFSKEGAGRRPGTLFLFFLGLGFCNHWPTQSLLIVVLIPCLWIFHRAEKRPWPGASSLLIWASLLGCVLSAYLYLPLRGSLNPPLDFGAPTNFHRLLATIGRFSYAKEETLASNLDYFWPIFADKAGYISYHILREFSPLYLLFALLGLFSLARKNKAAGLTVSALFLTTLLASLFYLQVSPIEFWHMADHLLTLNWLTGFLAACGLLYLWDYLRFRFRRRHNVFIIFALVVFFYSCLSTFWNGLAINNQTRQFLYYGYGLTALKCLPSNAVYFSEVDYDYFSALYLTEVLGLRPDIHLILSPELNRTYQYGHELLKDRALFQCDGAGPFDKALLFKSLQDPAIPFPVYCTYPNGYFEGLYAELFPRFAFEPRGLLTHVFRPGERPYPADNFSILYDFYRHYLEPEAKNPSEVNGLFLEICAHPLLNAANYARAFHDESHLSWYYSTALSLITEPDFRRRTIEGIEKGPWWNPKDNLEKGH